MISRKKSKIIFSFLVLAASFLLAAQLALAEGTAAPKSTNYGLDTTGNVGYGVSQADLAKNSNIPAIIGRVVGTLLAFLGTVFFLLILYAGLTWILSMGKEEKINESKDIIMAAVLGLIVVLGAYAITNVVARIFTDTTGVPR